MQKTDTSAPLTRALFFLTLLWGIAIFWIAPKPPLIDLPQHAGQVSLLHDIVSGISPWSDIFRLNLWTPYLIGYGLALPLNYIMSAGAAIQVVLSVAYIAFVLLGSRLRAHFGADARLDWLFLPTFFGFAYSWGFYTFLVSTPVVFLFVLVVDQYAQRATLKGGLIVILTGIMLLLSHGLAFVFGGLVAGGLYTMRYYTAGGDWIKRWLRDFWALLVPAVACVILFLVSMRIQSEYWSHGKLDLSWDLSIMRFPRLLANSVGDYYTPKMVLVVAALVMFIAPWLLGLRPNWRNPAAWVLLGVVAVIELVVPSTMIATAYVYQRFAVFALPAYALIFIAVSMRTASATAAPAAGMRKTVPMAILMVCVWTTFAFHSVEMYKFAQEAKDFEAVMSKMEPKQRVLALTFDSRSEDANLDLAYRHYATWYQSEKQGLVDFNFAWFPPQIVRFKPDQLPKVKEGLKAEGFTVEKYPLDPYRYIITRHTKALPADLFKGADCAPRMVIKQGTWTLFERVGCQVAQHDGARNLPVPG